MGKDTGGAAFPHSFTQDSIGDCQGMSLRDYFAAKIAAGDAASGNGWDDDRITELVLINRARLYYRIADAMLAVRGREN